MMTPRNRQKPRQIDDRDDWDDDPGQPAGGRQTAAGGGLAERRRTSKHRAPKQKGKPPQRRPKPSTTGKSKAKEATARSKVSLVERISPDFFTKRLIRIIWVVLLALVVIGFGIFFYFFYAGWRFFALRDVEVVGNKQLQREYIESIARESAKEGVLRADLEKIRDELRKNGIVRRVDVTRMLPDMLKIEIEEREPYALARRGDSRSESSVVCVDQEGVMFGDQSLCKAKSALPLVNGLEEGVDRAATARNQQRLAAYQRLLKDLEGATEKLSSRIEEVYFDNEMSVRVTVEAPDKEGVIVIYLGKEDFRVRLNAALDVLEAIYRQDAEALNVLRISDAEKLLSGARISYINATKPKRVVVGLEE
jgi:cell division septal protein FtsQ